MKFLKKNYKTIIYYFCLGFVINTIPYILDMVENKKNTRLESLEKNFLKIKQEEICKEKSEYSKFFEMGFEKIAQKRLLSCLRQSNLIE